MNWIENLDYCKSCEGNPHTERFRAALALDELEVDFKALRLSRSGRIEYAEVHVTWVPSTRVPGAGTSARWVSSLQHDDPLRLNVITGVDDFVRRLKLHMKVHLAAIIEAETLRTNAVSAVQRTDDE